ncbi:DUF1501 domain-containing protein [Schlesneria sp. T3-172]|uniref:DUF1501 domain-containing protein n=1 Tax=Schlesneria sphaerica TaxID=3373610 RepID=UPI0037C84658
MWGNHHSLPVSRRRLLHQGCLGVFGLGCAGQLAAEAPLPGRTSTSLRPEPGYSCIFIVQYGGASHIDSFDLKPLAPDNVRGPFQPIATRTPGLEVCEHLPQLAQQSDKFTIIRSMTHGNPGHDGGMHVAMTGHSMPRPETPYFGSVISRLQPARRNIPSYVWLQNLAGDVEPRYLKGGFLGVSHGPLRVGTDLDNPSARDFHFAGFDPLEGNAPERLQSRQKLLQALSDRLIAADAEEGQSVSKSPVSGFQRFQEKAFDLITGTHASAAFDLSRESSHMRHRYGHHPLGQNLLMARRLVEAGVRQVSVTAWCGVAEGEKFVHTQTWDMHGPSAGSHLGSIFGSGSFGLGFALPRVDQAVSALLEDLDDRGLLAQTLVVLVGEFGRAPRIFEQGRDHWPACYSALIAGAGVQGGLVYGASDPQGSYVRDKPVTPEDFSATLFKAMGIDPNSRIGLDGFTHPASTGEPVSEILRI